MTYERTLPGIAGRECPVEDCDYEKRPTDLMCLDHWSRVPRAIRDRVWKHWRARLKGDRAAIALHREACRDAIAAIPREGR
jgi:hypothetical protein